MKTRGRPNQTLEMLDPDLFGYLRSGRRKYQEAAQAGSGDQQHADQANKVAMECHMEGVYRYGKYKWDQAVNAISDEEQEKVREYQTKCLSLIQEQQLFLA